MEKEAGGEGNRRQVRRRGGKGAGGEVREQEGRQGSRRGGNGKGGEAKEPEGMQWSRRER